MPLTICFYIYMQTIPIIKTFQHKNVHTIEHQLNEDFTNLCRLFVDNKLSIRLGEDMTDAHFLVRSLS